MLPVYIYEKFPLSFPSKNEILVQKTPTSLREKRTGWCRWALIVYVDVHMELTPPTIHTRPPEPDPLLTDGPLYSKCRYISANFFKNQTYFS